jgi:hypothetical protein
VAGHRRDGGALRHPNFRWHALPLLVHPDLQRLLDQLQETAISNPLGAQRPELAGQEAGKVRLEVDVHDAPGPVVQVFSKRQGRLFGSPLRPVAVGAVVTIGLTDGLHDEPQSRLDSAIFPRGAAERSRAPLGCGYLDHAHGRALGALLA